MFTKKIKTLLSFIMNATCWLEPVPTYSTGIKTRKKVRTNKQAKMRKASKLAKKARRRKK